MPKAMLLGLLIESLRWHERAGVAREDDAVLNACRALRYAAEETRSSKAEAGEWARGRVDDAPLVSDALAARTDDRRLDPDGAPRSWRRRGGLSRRWRRPTTARHLLDTGF